MSRSGSCSLSTSSSRVAAKKEVNGVDNRRGATVEWWCCCHRRMACALPSSPFRPYPWFFGGGCGVAVVAGTGSRPPSRIQGNSVMLVPEFALAAAVVSTAGFASEVASG